MHSDTGGSPLYDLGERFVEHCGEAGPEQSFENMMCDLQSSHGGIEFFSAKSAQNKTILLLPDSCLYDRLGEHGGLASDNTE